MKSSSITFNLIFKLVYLISILTNLMVFSMLALIKTTAATSSSNAEATAYSGVVESSSKVGDGIPVDMYVPLLIDSTPIDDLTTTTTTTRPTTTDRNLLRKKAVNYDLLDLKSIELVAKANQTRQQKQQRSPFSPTESGEITTDSPLGDSRDASRQYSRQYSPSRTRTSSSTSSMTTPSSSSRNYAPTARSMRTTIPTTTRSINFSTSTIPTPTTANTSRRSRATTSTPTTTTTTTSTPTILRLRTTTNARPITTTITTTPRPRTFTTLKIPPTTDTISRSITTIRPRVTISRQTTTATTARPAITTTTTPTTTSSTASSTPPTTATTTTATITTAKPITSSTSSLFYDTSTTTSTTPDPLSWSSLRKSPSQIVAKHSLPVKRALLPTNVTTKPTAEISSPQINVTTTTPPIIKPNNSGIQKSPRMVQRLVAGHIENTQGRSSFHPNNTNNFKLRKPLAASNNTDAITIYKHSELNAAASKKTKIELIPAISENTIDKSDNDYKDDEALLEDTNDENNWDNGILRLSAGGGKQSLHKLKKSKDDSKKTLADQVRDGKYGLIEKELFRKVPKRPGVLSYLPNKEVPLDNKYNYGGLHEDDIWLAEDHLLVIKGGGLNEDHPDEPWPAIDDYRAPDRPIKIPLNPKIPPPFPVQLEENGPVHLIGNNKLTIVYPIANKSLPIYSASSEASNASSQSESDDEKNFITRPGTPANIKENNTTNNYPSPPPPWLYHNQTFVNPSLNNPRPHNFPFLGPFPINQNKSLDKLNDNNEDFDEDDPALYYPPAYSFVYKSNYSMAVPAGPLVPGIVVPPPPNQFAYLDKPTKERKPLSSISFGIMNKNRLYGTLTSTTSTTTENHVTYTSTLPPLSSSAQFGNSITKISEYIPKTINISPIRLSNSAPLPTPVTQIIQTVPVAVAVPIPIYPVNYAQEENQPDVNDFETSTPDSNTDTFSKTNPIYYEYFEAKRQQPISNVIDEFLATTDKSSSSPKPAKLYTTPKKAYKQHTYLQPLTTNRNYNRNNNKNNNNYEDDGIVVITPKPDIRNKPRPIYKERPLENFEKEVNNIQDSLYYYHNKDNNIAKDNHKAKAVFDYSFDSTRTANDEYTDSFRSRPEFDAEPFKPMVTYSPLLNDENSFHVVSLKQLTKSELKSRENPDISNNPTTTLLPVQLPIRPKKLRFRSKYLHQPILSNYQQQAQQLYKNSAQQGNWVAVDTDSDYNINRNRPEGESFQLSFPILKQTTKHNEFNNYYQPNQQQQQQQQPTPGRQNNRFYEAPFLNIPNRNVANFRSQQYLRPQYQNPPIWSLENDTYVNYAPNRPPINPDAEFINPYQIIPLQPYNQGRLPALSHQSQYFAPPQQRQQQTVRQYLPQTQQQYQHIPLHRDILVNYRQPLPPVNPDSEFISHPQVVPPQPINDIYRTNFYRLSTNDANKVSTSAQGNSNSPDIYYLTSKYRRANNNHNDNSQNGRVNNQNNNKINRSGNDNYNNNCC